jgi:hypothetical protein
MQTERRFVGYFPALPLEKNLELGEWIAGVPPSGTPWASDRFRELSEKLVWSYQKRGFTDASMLWHRDRGFDGSKPSDAEIGCARDGTRRSPSGELKVRRSTRRPAGLPPERHGTALAGAHGDYGVVRGGTPGTVAGSSSP